jgi:hypothetical protein
MIKQLKPCSTCPWRLENQTENVADLACFMDGLSCAGDTECARLRSRRESMWFAEGVSSGKPMGCHRSVGLKAWWLELGRWIKLRESVSRWEWMRHVPRLEALGREVRWSECKGSIVLQERALIRARLGGTNALRGATIEAEIASRMLGEPIDGPLSTPELLPAADPGVWDDEIASEQVPAFTPEEREALQALREAA